jgi:predicted dehydrogenase
MSTASSAAAAAAGDGLGRVRWGILGVAKINDRWLPSFARTRHAELVAIASRDAHKAQEAARAAGVARAHAGYEALLEDPQVEAVYIPLPNTMHAEWTRKAADRGKHVLCEKPLTPTAPQAEELVEYCAARGVKLMDGFMWPHHPRTALIRQVIDNGGIGPVTHVAGAFTFPLPLDPSNIRLRPETAGGSLLDVGCYLVYGIRWAFGEEPVRAYATGRYDYGVDLEMSGMVCLADGRTGTFDCGFLGPMRQWLEITGSEGVIYVLDMWVPPLARAAFTITRADREPEVVVVENEDQVAHMIDRFSLAVRGGATLPDPREAVKTLAVLDALADAAQEEREIDV